MQTPTLSGFQLSPQQKRLWLLQQDSPAYLTQCAIRLEGAIKTEILQAAITQIINRQGIFRTNFRRLPGLKFPVMTVLDSDSVAWQDIDLSDSNGQEESAKIEQLFQKLRCESWDLEQGSMLRLSLLKLAENTQILLISLPALCADTWTVKNLVTEISNAYSACIKGEELSGEVVQYLQFSEWQNQLLMDEDAAAANEYWQQQKLSLLATSKLPFERQALEKSEFQPNCFRLALAPNVTAKLVTLAHKYNTSESVVLLACWQTLIWRLIGQPDIIIGMAAERREYEELHELMGLVATWLLIKSHLTPDLLFPEVIELAKQAIDAASQWQDYFVPEPVENNTHLAFPIGFEFEQLPEKSSVAGVSFSLDKQYSCIEPFKVKLTCTWCNNSLTAEFYYDVNYFRADTIQRLASQFQTLLVNVTENPQTSISQLGILQPSDRHQLLVEFNQTQVQYSQDKCIHQLFAEQADQTPNNIAIVFEDQQLTYAELNHKANQLAHYLQQQGVKPEVVVGLYVERSLEMMIGLLGILKAGGAYLPLEPTLPQESLTFRLRDAQTSLIISDSSLVNNLGQRKVICLDTDWDTIAQYSNANPTTEVTNENLVYVLFTSGSTGKPKGVAIEHRQLLNYLNGILNKLNLPTNASFATVSSLAADLGNTAIFPALCTGGCLHVISRDRATNPEALAEYCDRYPIDCLKIVPSHLNALLKASHPEKILPKQRLILGGEALSWKLVENIQQYTASCQILNHYGPTEATIGVATFTLKDEPLSDKSDTVPIGCPLTNTQLYILDSHLQPVPIDVPGELYIGGDSVARGYINHPELTHERFIPNPFEGVAQSKDDSCGVDILSAPEIQGTGKMPIPQNHQNRPATMQRPFEKSKAKRLYKTGDLARYLSDGNIEFLGRIDNQVKIRGFRVELAEIETGLRQHPAIRETTVLAMEDESGNQRLIAYIVANQQIDSVTDIRNFLNEKLPDYMIPSAFVRLKALPLTPNGKVDRQALPALDSIKPELAGIFVAPRTPIEETIAQIWAEVLELQRVGINDNFFELGGDSIMSIQIAARINRTGLHLTPKQLFENPTIAELASVVDTTTTIETEQNITHNQSTESAGSQTTSDFPKANLSQKELDKLLAKINQGRVKTSN